MLNRHSATIQSQKEDEKEFYTKNFDVSKVKYNRTVKGISFDGYFVDVKREKETVYNGGFYFVWEDSNVYAYTMKGLKAKFMELVELDQDHHI